LGFKTVIRVLYGTAVGSRIRSDPGCSGETFPIFHLGEMAL
jgi:hypothetical protein